MKRALLTIIFALAFALTSHAQFCCFWDAKGRVTDEYGRSVKAVVNLYGCSTPECTETRVWSTRSNTFGYFSFGLIPAQEYVIEVNAKQGTYAGIVGPLLSPYMEVVVR